LDFTAIVVTWNSAREIPGLIESVQRHLGEGCRLLFVDNASSDDTLEVIRTLSPQSRVISLPVNAGFAEANNIGVQEAETEVVALLNPDTLMIDDSLGSLAELASRERALFAPRLFNEDGSVQISARPALTSWESGLLSVWPGALMPGWIRRRCEPWRYDERLPAGWISGACLVAQRELLLGLGPFDERLILYGEDADLCLRAWQAGIPSVSAPDVARLVHLGGRSAAQAFTDNGMRRKVEVRWWIIAERLGRARAGLDLVLQFLLFGSRWVARRLLGRDAGNESLWLRAAAGFVRDRSARVPPPLRSSAAAGNSSDFPEVDALTDSTNVDRVPVSRRFAQMKRPRWLRNAWFGTRYQLGSHAVTFPLLHFAPAPYARVMVRRGMDACIDGLPRSSNTFAGWAFLDQNPEVDLAHHVHLPMQFRRAVRLGIPTAVLIREPLGNLTSLVIAGENDLSHDLAFRVYLHYYGQAASLRDRIALCTFDEVLDDPSVVARRLNESFGTGFRADPMGEDEKQRIVELLKRNEERMGSRPAHATVPTEYKESLKPIVRSELARHRLLPAAEALYADLTRDL
jgi:hypothetical protein